MRELPEGVTKDAMFAEMNTSDPVLIYMMGLELDDILLLQWLHSHFHNDTLFTLKITHNGVVYRWVKAEILAKNLWILGCATSASFLARLNKLCGSMAEKMGYTSEQYPLMKHTIAQHMDQDTNTWVGQRAYYAIREDIYQQLNKNDTCRILITPAEESDAEPATTEPAIVEQSTPVETPVVDPSAITPTTVEFVERVVAANPSAFSALRIDLENPSKSLIRLQAMLTSLYAGTFMQDYSNEIPEDLRGVVLPTVTEDLLVSCMGGLKAQKSKMSIPDYILGYNGATKKAFSLFLSFMSKQKKATDTPRTSSTPVKKSSTPLLPAVKAYFDPRIADGRLAKTATRMKTTPEHIIRVGNVICEWMDEYGEAFCRRKEPLMGLGRWDAIYGKLLQFVDDGCLQRINKTSSEFWSNIQPFNTDNKEWLMFARWIRHEKEGPMLCAKPQNKLIDNNPESWYYVDYRLIHPDIN